MSKVSLDDALEIHTELMQFFRDGHCATVKEIAERYRVTPRTALRYLTRVERYVPLEREAHHYRKAALR